MLNKVANKLANKLDCKLDPATIIMVLCSILGLLMQCWSFLNKDQLHERLVKQCQDPKQKSRLIKRAAKQFKRKLDITTEESIMLAATTIEEALMDPAIFNNCMPLSAQKYLEEQCDE